MELLPELITNMTICDWNKFIYKKALAFLALYGSNNNGVEYIIDGTATT